MDRTSRSFNTVPHIATASLKEEKEYLCLSTSSPTCILQASKTWRTTGKPSWPPWVAGTLPGLMASGTFHVSSGLLHTLQDHLSSLKINLVQDYARESCFMNFYSSIPAKGNLGFALTRPCQGTLVHSTKPSVSTSPLQSLGHPLRPPMDMPAAHTKAEGTCETRLVTKCQHTSICPFQSLFSHVHLWGGKKMQLPEHHFKCEKTRRCMVARISAALPLTPEKRVTFKNGNLIKDHK